MLVGHHGELVEAVAGERAQPLEMRSYRRTQAGLEAGDSRSWNWRSIEVEVPAMRIGGDVLARRAVV